MSLFVDALELFDGNVGIDLRGRKASVAEQFLHATQVGAAIKQMRRKAVAQ